MADKITNALHAEQLGLSLQRRRMVGVGRRWPLRIIESGKEHKQSWWVYYILLKVLSSRTRAFRSTERDKFLSRKKEKDTRCGDKSSIYDFCGDSPRAGAIRSLEACKLMTSKSKAEPNLNTISQFLEMQALKKEHDSVLANVYSLKNLACIMGITILSEQ